ncbi:hypothetical protein QBC33DRAFT_609756 [Phialemonium atrogriseum]|uniref:DUF3405 domain-containing protein n=1 Tax=Phialemonium atrogriseum TaxID=1093897 RepID=A0AAJ0C4G5_9PEZI|nr:uncharacterized protein QBC33DRAFT_609756 [Phialemonium atrogriseum]KAK1769756.1 hypothetical protein QBC33DRAFT_609756 [Phialemonium atrogriseum]
MAFFLVSLRRLRASRPARLPLYEEPGSPVSTKERYSTTDDSSETDTDEDDNLPDCSLLSPAETGSRQSSSSQSSTSHMLPRKPIARPRRPPGRYLSRLRNKIVRYLCIGLITTIVLFIFSLVRASQVENRRIAAGMVEKKPPPPPAWESFDFLTRYYGGIRTLVPLSENIPEYPRLEDEQPYNASTSARSSKRGNDANELGPAYRALAPSKTFSDHPQSFTRDGAKEIRECFLDPQNTVRVPPIRYYDGRPKGFPNNVLGSYDLLSIPEDICFERYGRYGPYGFGYPIRSGGLGLGAHGENEGSGDVWQAVPRVDWSKLDWADIQRRCYEVNAQRYSPVVTRPTLSRGFYVGEESGAAELKTREGAPPQMVKASRPVASSTASAEAPAKTNGTMPRTAFVVRCWDEFEWNEDDIMNLRSLIAEIALASGGRYDIHLLVEVKNDAKYPIWADDEAYRNRIKESVPEEFQGLVTLWAQTQMLALYQGIHDLYSTGPDNPVHGAYRGLQMAMQHFAYGHPEYDYFWQWEMDVRYTGHYYDLISKLEGWAKEQPRKGLWERNARFYMPDVHGTWEDFKQMARVQSDLGTVGAGNVWGGVPGSAKEPPVKKADENVWGPVRPVDEEDWYETDNDPQPPTTQERDKYSWGVGEEADFITLNPLFDPEGTTWGLANDITGYNETEGIAKPPRRAQIITASRMSRQLLMTMHRETAFKKHHAFPEMWPATVSLHHGYKAVFAPHPVYVDREWPVEYMARVLNGGRNGASGGSRASVFGEREHNLRGLTWFYNSGFGGNLYRRWLGLRVNNDGGEGFETTADLSKNDSAVPFMRGGEGRMCLPPMLLHPVKGVVLPVEGTPDDGEIPESDPAA